MNRIELVHISFNFLQHDPNARKAQRVWIPEFRGLVTWINPEVHHLLAQFA